MYEGPISFGCLRLGSGHRHSVRSLPQWPLLGRCPPVDLYRLVACRVRSRSAALLQQNVTSCVFHLFAAVHVGAACEPGQYQNETSLSNCVFCPANFWQAQEASSFCWATCNQTWSLPGSQGFSWCPDMSSVSVEKCLYCNGTCACAGCRLSFEALQNVTVFTAVAVVVFCYQAQPTPIAQELSVQRRSSSGRLPITRTTTSARPRARPNATLRTATEAMARCFACSSIFAGARWGSARQTRRLFNS